MDVFDVVEVEARDGECLEVLDCGGFFEAGHGGGGRGETPGGEGAESSGFFLQVAEGFEVIEAMLDSFAAAEDHGGGGLDSEGVGSAVDCQPVFGGDWDFIVLVDAVVEDSCVVAGDGI